MNTYNLTLDQIISLVDNQTIERSTIFDSVCYSINCKQYYLRVSYTKQGDVIEIGHARLAIKSYWKPTGHYYLDDDSKYNLILWLSAEWNQRQHEQYEEKKGHLTKWLSKLN